MKVKELIERLQSIDQDLDVYIYNEKEHSLFLVDTVNQTCDYGESENGIDDWEDFVTIFPKTKSQPLFTLTAEEVEIVGYLFKKITLDFFDSCDDILKSINLLTRIKQWNGKAKNNKQSNASACL